MRLDLQMFVQGHAAANVTDTNTQYQRYRNQDGKYSSYRHERNQIANKLEALRYITYNALIEEE